MYFPDGFDPGRTYPVIDHIYAGAQWAFAAHAFDPDWPANPRRAAVLRRGVLAGAGTARLRRGHGRWPRHAERTKAFHDFIVGNWGDVTDHAETIRQLCAREPFLDSDRVGVYGHSWGGYHAFRCLVDHPDVYRAALCSAPGFDVYALLLYESYLGFPQQNPAAYRAAEVFRRTGEVQGELMIVNGTAHHFTFTDGIKMAEALIQAGKAHEFVLLPEQIHDPTGCTTGTSGARRRTSSGARCLRFRAIRPQAARPGRRLP